MKRRDLVRHLTREGCVLSREGSSHSVFFNPNNGHSATIPRHTEVQINLARTICRQLEISLPNAGS
jgi:mRNA interferase HicA